jgi:hypothetical protein
VTPLAGTAGSGGVMPHSSASAAGSVATDDAGVERQPDSSCQPLCSTFAAPEQVGKIAISELSALSGLAASRKNPGILYAHNDHDRPTVYALDQQGRSHARIVPQAASASDIEDIAVGPCPDGSCVYLGDIGDNAAMRSEYAVLRFSEPSVSEQPGDSELSAQYQRFAFRYPDGSHNAEGLMVAPDSTIYVVTKLTEGGHSHVYRLPNPPDSTAINMATHVVELPIPTGTDKAASAAAAHPCGLGFVIRTYNRIYLFRASTSELASAFAAQPEVIGMPEEPQSEGIDFTPDGLSVISSGEGDAAPIFKTGCQ